MWRRRHCGAKGALKVTEHIMDSRRLPGDQEADHSLNPEEKAAESLTLTDELEGSNVVAIRMMRSYAGKTNNLTSLVDVLRQCDNDPYGVISRWTTRIFENSQGMHWR